MAPAIPRRCGAVGPVPGGVSARSSVTELPVQPSRLIPLKSSPDVVVSSWQVWHPQPLPRRAACPHPAAAKISLLHPPPQPPGGAEMKPAVTPRRTGSRPRDLLGGAGRAEGTGRKLWRKGTGTGTGRVCWWHNVFLPAVAAARRGRLRSRRRLSGPPPGANGGRRVSASSGSTGTRPGNGRGGKSTSMKGQRRSHISPTQAGVSHLTSLHPHIPIPAVTRLSVPMSPSPPLPCQIQHSHSHIPIPTFPFLHPHSPIPIPIPTSPYPLPHVPLQPPRRPLWAVCPGGIGSVVVHLHPGPAACLHSLCAWDIFHLDPGSCTAPAPAVNVNVYG